MTPTAECRCGKSVPLDALLEHLRLIHPDDYGDGLETWLDGSAVIVDHTLDPDDFGGPGEPEDSAHG